MKYLSDGEYLGNITYLDLLRVFDPKEFLVQPSPLLIPPPKSLGHPMPFEFFFHQSQVKKFGPSSDNWNPPSPMIPELSCPWRTLHMLEKANEFHLTRVKKQLLRFHLNCHIHCSQVKSILEVHFFQDSQVRGITGRNCVAKKCVANGDH
jgi:hypothetical protein